MKLIMVGMRYADAKAVAATPIGSKISLNLVSNNEGVDSRAVQCFNSKGLHVGFIRNTDLPTLFPYMQNKDEFATVKSKYENYWILEFIHLPKTDTISGPGSETYSSYITNASTSISNLIQKEKTMVTTNMRDYFFREVKNVAMDMQSGKFGIKSPEGITIFKPEGISVNPIVEMGFSIPAFAMRAEVSTLKAGDIVLNSDVPTFFKEYDKETSGYTVIATNGEEIKMGNVTNLFFGKNSVLAVKNMFGEGSEGAMNPMMMALMMGSDSGKGIDTKTLMLMSMMGGGKGMDPNMMMMLALSGK